jgi:hypothetical protein
MFEYEIPSYLRSMQRIDCLLFIDAVFFNSFHFHSVQVGVGEKRSRGGFLDYSEIDRPVSSHEMEETLNYAKKLG